MFLSSWQKDQWVSAPKPILVTSLKEKAHLSTPLRAFLPVCARAVSTAWWEVGSGQRPPQWCLKALCLLWKFPREHCSVTILDPTSDPHSSPTERRREARKATDRKELHSFMLQWCACPSWVQFSSVAQSCPTLWDPMNRSTPGLPVHHQLQEFTQTHVHRVGDAIQPSHPLSSPSPPAPNPSQHQDLFQWVNSSHEVAKVLEFQLQHQSFQWKPRTDLL